MNAERRVYTDDGDCEVYAVPGDHNVVDFVDQDTGLTFVCGHTADEVRERHPGAVRMRLSAWREERGARQHVPFSWVETTEARYWEMLEVLPPAAQVRGAFLVGEPVTHSARTGEPMYEAYRQRKVDGGDVYEHATRALTPSEFREAIASAAMSAVDARCRVPVDPVLRRLREADCRKPPAPLSTPRSPRSATAPSSAAATASSR